MKKSLISKVAGIAAAVVLAVGIAGAGTLASAQPAEAATNTKATAAINSLKTQTGFKPGACGWKSWTSPYPNGWTNCKAGCWYFVANVEQRLVGAYPGGPCAYTLTSPGSFNKVDAITDSPSANPSYSGLQTLMKKAYPGDVIQFKGGPSGWGSWQHTAVVEAVDDNGVRIYQHDDSSHVTSNYYNWSFFYNTYLDFDAWTNWTKGISLYHYGNYASKFPSTTATTTPSGKAMSSGAGKTLPDGDCEIVSLTNRSCLMDISGDKVPVASGTNVNLWSRGSAPRKQDVFTLTYPNNGFYSIKQKGTNMSLDVAGGSTAQEANVQMYSSNSANAQQFSISTIAVGGTVNGYRIQAKCSGFSIDVAGGKGANGTNIQQWPNNNTAAQGWVFIPYQPEQPISNGHYVLTSALSNSVELDVSGNTGDLKDGANVQIWADNALSQYNSFDVKKLSNGYYKLVHVASGKALDSYGGVTTQGANVEVWTDNGGDAQQWAITKQGNGYLLRPRCSGMALDACNSGTANGTNVQQWAFNGGKNQIWGFAVAEHKVSYDANGGKGAPAAQTKHYKNALTLSSSVPTRSGYTFAGWATVTGASQVSYQPGASYSRDADVTLYAVWRTAGKAKKPTLSGANYPTKIKKGKNFGLKGTISGNGSKLTKVTAGAYTKKGKLKTGKTLSVNAASVNIAKRLNKYVAFNKLAKGTYYYKVIAKSAVGTYTLLNKKFKVY